VESVNWLHLNREFLKKKLKTRFEKGIRDNQLDYISRGVSGRNMGYALPRWNFLPAAAVDRGWLMRPAGERWKYFTSPSSHPSYHMLCTPSRWPFVLKKIPSARNRYSTLTFHTAHPKITPKLSLQERSTFIHFFPPCCILFCIKCVIYLTPRDNEVLLFRWYY
jgi:hypothetical protein